VLGKTLGGAEDGALAVGTGMRETRSLMDVAKRKTSCVDPAAIERWLPSTPRLVQG